MTTVNLTDNQYYLVRSALELLYEDDLEEIDFYSSREHFNKSELDSYLKEADDICDLIHYLRSFISLEQGGEE